MQRSCARRSRPSVTSTGSRSVLAQSRPVPRCLDRGQGFAFWHSCFGSGCGHLADIVGRSRHAYGYKCQRSISKTPPHTLFALLLIDISFGLCRNVGKCNTSANPIDPTV
jgi:hypothetical protein